MHAFLNGPGMEVLECIHYKRHMNLNFRLIINKDENCHHSFNQEITGLNISCSALKI